MVTELSWPTFDDYKRQVGTVHYVDWMRKDWIKSVCSCEHWAKNYVCHHIVGLAVFKEKAAFLEVHMEIAIGKTRPRGQPKKTASALVRQNDKTKESE